MIEGHQLPEWVGGNPSACSLGPAIIIIDIVNGTVIEARLKPSKKGQSSLTHVPNNKHQPAAWTCDSEESGLGQCGATLFAICVQCLDARGITVVGGRLRAAKSRPLRPGVSATAPTDTTEARPHWPDAPQLVTTGFRHSPYPPSSYIPCAHHAIQRRPAGHTNEGASPGSRVYLGLCPSGPPHSPV